MLDTNERGGRVERRNSLRDRNASRELGLWSGGGDRRKSRRKRQKTEN